MRKILKFFSPTCGPCKVMSKNLSTLEDIEIQDVDITDDSNEPLLEKYGIRTVPTTVVLNESDELVQEFKGVVPIEKIKEVCCF